MHQQPSCRAGLFALVVKNGHYSEAFIIEPGAIIVGVRETDGVVAHALGNSN